MRGLYCPTCLTRRPLARAHLHPFLKWAAVTHTRSQRLRFRHWLLLKQERVRAAVLWDVRTYKGSSCVLPSSVSGRNRPLSTVRTVYRRVGECWQLLHRHQVTSLYYVKARKPHRKHAANARSQRIVFMSDRRWDDYQFDGWLDAPIVSYCPPITHKWLSQVAAYSFFTRVLEPQSHVFCWTCLY